MKVIQLIDTLNPGGAERIAVNYANLLNKKYNHSFLAVSRELGMLENELHPGVKYLCLEKRNTFDLKALKKFRNFVLKNDIDIIHAHTTSYFFAILTKMTLPTIKIVWHDHHGNRVNAKYIKNLSIILFSIFFSGVICVNEILVEWARKNLFCKNVIYLKNYLVNQTDAKGETDLHGINGKRIVVVANLRSPKNHLMFLKAFRQISIKHAEWTLHLIGKINNDAYSEDLFDYVTNNDLKDKVFIYGQKQDVPYILSQSTIGVIASTSEGLPMALLEYGRNGLCIITTNVGKCGEIIKEKGIVLDEINIKSFEKAMDELIRDESLRKEYSSKIKKYIDENYSENSVINDISLFYEGIIKN